MLVVRTERFKRDFKRLPPEVQRRTEGALERFIVNRRHPSLQVKKMEGALAIWEMRVTDNYRVTFQVFQDGVQLRRIGTHDVLRQS